VKYLDDMGGEENASLAERQLVNDNSGVTSLSRPWTQLQNKRQLIRKGKPHPLIELRMRVAGHRRDNYKIAGLNRVRKVKTISDLLNGHYESPVNDNGKAGTLGLRERS
jgi:hypothetical protein